MNDIEINERELYKLFDTIKDKISCESLMKALTSGGMVLRDSAKTRLLKKMPKAAKAVGREKDNITMAEGVRVSKNKASERPVVTVYILGNYLNRWFEKGTDSRQLKRNHKADRNHHRRYKKGENRGSLKALHFFADAREQDMKKVTEKIIEVVENEIGKIWD